MLTYRTPRLTGREERALLVQAFVRFTDRHLYDAQPSQSRLKVHHLGLSKLSDIVPGEDGIAPAQTIFDILMALDLFPMIR